MKPQSYAHEFKLVHVKLAYNMNDLTKEEIRMWHRVLQLDSPLDEHHVDFFDEDQDYYWGEIMIRTWEWTHSGRTDYLIDMNAWPGDNEAGLIFLNGQEVVISNGDQSLYVLEDVYSDELHARVPTLQKLRLDNTDDNSS